MRKSYCKFFGYLVAWFISSWSFAQEPEAPTVTATRKISQFPTEWFGHWKGKVQTQSPSGKSDTFEMELKIAPTDDRDRFQWTIVYEGAQGRNERLYTLVAKDPDKGQFVVDENNGITMEATLIGDTLSEHFVVEGQRVWTTSRLVQTSLGKEIHFELSSADDTQAIKSGGKNGTPEVVSLRLNSHQRAILKPIDEAKSNPSDSKSNTSSKIWKKLETEAYRGKQDDIFLSMNA